MSVIVLSSLLLGIILFIFPSPSSTQIESDADLMEVSSYPTNLALSPWELFVLGDLIFRLTEKQCPKINADVLTSFKQQFSDALKSVPKSDLQNDGFLPAYSHLVQCVDYLMMKRGEIEMDEKRLKSMEASPPHPPLEVGSSEDDWTVKDPTTTPKSKPEATPIPVEAETGILASISKWLWNLSPIRIFVITQTTTTTDSPPPEVKKEEVKVEVQVPDGGDDARKEQKRKHLQVYHRARQDIANFFHEASKLVRRTCPVIHRPDKVFMRQAVLDMTTWMTIEHHSAIMIANQFFEKQKLLKEIQECNKISTK